MQTNRALSLSNKSFIPTSEPLLDGNEEKYVLDTIRSNWISSAGKYIEEFEEKFASYIGVSYGVACSNGTTALHLALSVLGIGYGDEVIIPDFTIICSASMTILSGATPVIEDACASHGAQVGNKKVGGIGDIGCFSFYASKNITTGEGCMVVTNNKALADRARLLRSHAFEKPRFIHRFLGFNYRLTNLQAALGVAQVEH